MPEHDIYAMAVNKLVEKRNGDIVYLAKKGIIEMIINTPTKGRQSSRDGFKIRRSFATSLLLKIVTILSFFILTPQFICFEFKGKLSILN